MTEGQVPIATGETRHIPVLLAEVLDELAPKAGETYIDCTFGAGGYTRAILEKADCRVIALDRDPNAIRDGQALVEAFAPRLTLLHTPFSDIEAAIEALGLRGKIDGVVFDLGVSSMQLDEADRGFSFNADGPLDMRMSQAGPSAADVVNTYDEEDIANIIYELGDERRSRAIARAIVRRRGEHPFTRTSDLARLVEGVMHGKREAGRHPATRTFQALRMYVNEELGELERGLEGAERILRPEGRLVVVTFHSLEDRATKRFFATRAGKEEAVSRYLPLPEKPAQPPSFRILNPRGLTPKKGELDVNPRARSARLRSGLRTEALPWPATSRDP